MKGKIKEIVFSVLLWALIIAGVGFGLDACMSDNAKEPTGSYPGLSERLEEEERLQKEEALSRESEEAYREEIESKIEEANAISWEDAEDHIGEYTTIYGTVMDVSQPGVSGDPIFVDVGGSYPNKRVTGVCWEECHAQFDNLQSYDGSFVLMEGTLYMHDGTPNIKLTDSFQIREID